jgi:hypothetical protein
VKLMRSRTSLNAVRAAKFIARAAMTNDCVLERINVKS